MQVHEDILINHYKSMARVEPVVHDSTSIMTYKECPRKYFWRMVLGYDSKVTPPYLPWGSAYHKFREFLQVYNRQFESEGKDNPLVLAYTPAIDIAVAYWRKHGQDQPKDSKFPHCTEGMLKLACEVAFTQVIADYKSGRIKVVATEQPFTIKFNESDYLIGGRLDEIVKKSGVILDRDFKTAGDKDEYMYQRSLDPNFQFTCYIWSSRNLTNEDITGCLVEVMNIDKKKGPMIYELMTERTGGQLERWVLDTKYWLDQIKLSRDTDHYPQNERDCWRCPFHSPCKKPGESGTLADLMMNYTFRPWDFYTVHD